MSRQKDQLPERYRLQLPKFLTIPFYACMLLLLPRSTVQDSKSYYHSSLDLNFLCQSRTIPAFVRDVPWDCSSYVVCLNGRAFHSQCPADKMFSPKSHKCLFADLVDTSPCLGRIFNYADQICQANPTIRIPSPDSCSHYMDCKARRDIRARAGTSADYMDGLLECPYPRLFSPATGDCQHFSYVNCRHKFEPKAPCDYMQYLQLYRCARLDCSDCKRHHPSCLKMSDGYHPVPQRRDVMMKCRQERTVDFLTCPPGYRFSAPDSRRASGTNIVSPVTSPVCVRAV